MTARRISDKRIAAHVAFLEGTLIPDLRASGSDCCADDHALSVRIIRQLAAGRGVRR